MPQVRPVLVAGLGTVPPTALTPRTRFAGKPDGSSGGTVGRGGIAGTTTSSSISEVSARHCAFDPQPPNPTCDLP